MGGSIRYVGGYDELEVSAHGSGGACSCVRGALQNLWAGGGGFEMAIGGPHQKASLTARDECVLYCGEQ